MIWSHGTELIMLRRLSKQRKVGLDWYEFLCFGSHNLRPSTINSVPRDRTEYLQLSTTLTNRRRVKYIC